VIDLAAQSPATRDGSIEVSVRVSNLGTVAGDDTVEVYVHPDGSTVLQPPERLVAFQRVHLAAGQSTTVTLSIPTSRLADVPGDINGTAPLTVEPGRYTLIVADQEAEATVP
jgi:beta-glucosidase